jgi:uncharacterized protein YjbI with pentapeptide repeats
MLAVGLASVTFFNGLYARWIEASIELPQMESASPVIIFARNRDEMPNAGGSGPDAQGSLEVINTLGTNSSNKILENVDLQGAKFRGADLSGASIANSDFSNDDFSKANLSKAVIFYSSFIKSNLSNANLTGAKLHGSDLTDAQLNNTKFVRANLTHSDFSNATLANADLTDTNLSDARLETAKGLTYKQLQRAVINEFTSLPPHLISKRSFLMEQSRQKVKMLRKEMSKEDLELYIHPFNFLD